MRSFTPKYFMHVNILPTNAATTTTRNCHRLLISIPSLIWICTTIAPPRYVDIESGHKHKMKDMQSMFGRENSWIVLTLCECVFVVASLAVTASDYGFSTSNYLC
ncbi:unnamed protein product [Lactuca virosa]|uniref:CASP-like protein n=1 Tax=Lactuca virosa TaxID=75947 RepID=A0AAU9MMR8_9ASTR|nr:unnamed protein product [Lactuca virosa]